MKKFALLFATLAVVSVLLVLVLKVNEPSFRKSQQLFSYYAVGSGHHGSVAYEHVYHPTTVNHWGYNSVVPSYTPTVVGWGDDDDDHYWAYHLNNAWVSHGYNFPVGFNFASYKIPATVFSSNIDYNVAWPQYLRNHPVQYCPFRGPSVYYKNKKHSQVNVNHGPNCPMNH